MIAFFFTIIFCIHTNSQISTEPELFLNLLFRTSNCTSFCMRMGAVALIPTLSIPRIILSFFFALCYRATELPALLTSSIPSRSHHCPTSVPSCVSSRPPSVCCASRTHHELLQLTQQRVLRLINNIILTNLYLYYL